MVPEVERAYEALLTREGLGHLYAAESPFAPVDAEIRNTLAASGVTAPGFVYVGEFPHRSVHAQASQVPGGTLILLDTGLRALLDGVATITVASQLAFTRDPTGAVRHEVATPRQHQRRAETDAALAAVLVAYVCQTGAPPAPAPRPAPDPPTAFGLFMARAAERFAIGHEYGHLLAGHRHSPPGAGSATTSTTGPAPRDTGPQDTGPRDTGPQVTEPQDDTGPQSTGPRMSDVDVRRREDEADELAALMILRGLDEPSQFLWRALAVAGPFLLLAVDRLVARVRREIGGGPVAATHPPADARAARLRGIVAQLGEPTLLQIAEAWVSSLALREDSIAAETRRATRRPAR